MQKNVTENGSRIINYYYDRLGRLTAQTGAEEDTKNFTFDVNNNREALNSPMGNTSYSYDAAGHLKNPGYSFDANGNQLTGNGKTNTYNGFNQPYETNVKNSTLFYGYDSNGLRINKTVYTGGSEGVEYKDITYVLDGDQVVIELNEAYNVVGRYLRGFGLICSDTGEGSDKTYYNYNAHGDVTQLVNESGNVTKDYKYDSFGNEINIDSNDTNQFRYSGEYFDKETGYIYLRARYYDPNVGRFISEDSYTGEISDPLSLNLYTYCGQDPVNHVDPSGHDAIFFTEGLTVKLPFKNIEFS